MSAETLWRACAGSFLGDPARSRASVHGRSRYKEFDGSDANSSRNKTSLSCSLCDSRTPREAVSRGPPDSRRARLAAFFYLKIFKVPSLSVLVKKINTSPQELVWQKKTVDKRELKTLYKIQAGRRTAPPIRGDNPPGSCQISLLRDDTPAVPGHAAVRTESARQTRPAKHDCTEGDAVCTTGDAMSVPVVDTHPSLGVLPHRVRGSPTHTAARGGQDKCPLARDVGHSRFFRTFANRYAPRPTGIFGCRVVFGGLSKKNPSIDF
ncbi:hypothetical protein J6590_099151 [Homalodisca vitripennis]|nr:hypothetical protein J6590_099151 [Homalodisca vitripennis]